MHLKNYIFYLRLKKNSQVLDIDSSSKYRFALSFLFILSNQRTFQFQPYIVVSQIQPPIFPVVRG